MHALKNATAPYRFAVSVRARDFWPSSAARAANADEFVRALPQGYDTPVGERGATLSGGQKQRIAIARALLLDPRILILDDSTSSVDFATEERIQQALDVLMKGRTSFVIAHRLSTIKNAGMIAVISNGKIVEMGRHEELLEQGGVYRRLYQTQFRDAHEGVTTK